jgi:hypothetical protein
MSSLSAQPVSFVKILHCKTCKKHDWNLSSSRRFDLAVEDFCPSQALQRVLGPEWALALFLFSSSIDKNKKAYTIF